MLFFAGHIALFLFLEVALAKLEDKLQEMLEEPVSMLGYELMGMEFVRAGKNSVLRVYIEHENGITVDDCAEVSHQVSAVLDVEDPISTEYFLEVSSPGAEKPLFNKKHYESVVGEVIKLRLNIPLDGRRNYKGVLDEVNGDMITMTIDGQQHTLALNNIEKANLVFNFS